MNLLVGVEVEETETFTRAVKKLQKRFKNIKTDCDKFIDEINTTDDLGIHLGEGIYKVRITNTNKNRGKSSGYRLISYLKLIDKKLYLMYVYDKSDIANISEKEIDTLVKKTTLEANKIS